jgi:hypothetical protein
MKPHKLVCVSLTSLVILSSVFLLRSLGPAYADTPGYSPTGPISGQADTTPPTFPPSPLLAPAAGATVNTFKPSFDWTDATDSESEVVSYTLLITTSLAGTSNLTTTTSSYEPFNFFLNGVYTWTVQAHDAAGNAGAFATPPYTFTVQATALVYLPILAKSECPAASAATYSLIPIDGPAANRPAYLHGDLNLSLRGYEPTSGSLELVNIPGSTDPGAPQLAGLFGPNRYPGFRSVYRVYDWNWACGAQGCRGPLIADPAVTMAGLSAVSGESISIPERAANIWDDYKVMVLYAEERRLTLGYTRQDTVASGYAVHLEGLCVDPNLLALYLAQVNAAGFHSSGRLPGLRHNQPLGTALGNEIKVVIRDRGTFLDPRSRKDWWQGY